MKNMLMQAPAGLCSTQSTNQQHRRSLRTIVLTVLSLFLAVFLNAQSSGYINRPATILVGRAIFDPDQNNYTSASTSGFGGDDVTNSELPFKALPAFSNEPFGDLRRGPNHRFSDFVPDASKRGCYVYFNGTQLLFRFRVGSIMSGSKGYSVLFDTDGKFGATGPDADPDYQPETTGVNGNPGFEIEVVLETNFRIAIYNVGGLSSPALIKPYTNWEEMSQVSIAGTNDNGDPDYFIDFYIPFSDLQAAPFNLTTSSSLRMAATTVMAPKAAIGGPKSDIYGLDDSNYKSAAAEYEAYINSMPGFTLASISSGIDAMCTQAPVVTAPISSGTVTISGTWTKSSLSGAASVADITVYKDGVSIGTVTNVASGATWSLPNITLVNGNVITAKAKASTESMCLQSNSVSVQGCNTSNIASSTGFTISCSSVRGMEGTFVTGNEVKLYFIDPTTLVTSTLAGPTANSPTFGYNSTNWYYNGTAYNGNSIPSACTGGSPDMTNGVYYATTKSTSGTCESAPVFACVGLSGTTATPVITQSALFSSSTQVSGTATAGAQVRLYVNGQLKNTVTATGGVYSFTGLVLSLGDVVNVYAITTSSCMSAVATRTVSCYTSAPLINVDNSSQLTIGQAITGTSDEAAGTTIRVYTSTNSLVATTTVLSGGTWTTGSYVAAASTSYYATAQNGTCSVSSASGTFTAVSATTNRCGSISAVAAGDASISGTLTSAVANTTVNLYVDGTKAGSVVTGAATWTILASALTQPIYAYAVLTIGVQENGKTELLCSSAPTTVSCSSGPATPVFSPSSSTIYPGRSQTFTISNAVVGAFYALADGTTGQSLGTGVWATSNTVTLTTNSFLTGSYSVVVKGTTLTGVNVCSTPGTPASVTVTVPNNTTDVDDDDDGITDLVECGGIDPFGDADSDGIKNYLDTTPGGSVPAFTDLNGDGINDYFDTDRDGIINSLDLDSDNDGIADIVEAGGVDINGDGKIDGSADTDADGLIDIYDSNNGGTSIANLDTDGDGIKNAYDLDSDNDGIPDVVEAGGTDSNNDGIIDNFTDNDSDGFMDSVDGDSGNDGVAENTANVLIITGADTNNDGRPDSYPRANTDRMGLPNPYDLDADGDGILDTREAGLTDSNNDGIADGTLGSDGWSDTVDALASLNMPNTDSRGGANYLDIDSDDDGITDNVEAQATTSYMLPAGSDADGDGIDDNYDNNDASFGGNSNNGLTPNNHDGTDNPDYLDSDSDNDGVSDLKEGSGVLSTTITSTVDTDADGLLDQFDTFNLTTQSTNLQNNITLTGMGTNGSTAGPASAGSNVTAKQTMAGASNRDWRNLNFVLPLQLLQLGVEKQSGNALVKWQTANETRMKAYLVERSTDGAVFAPLATVAAKGSSLNNYSYLDNIANTTTPKVYYRLQQVDREGKIAYSKVVSLDLASTGLQLTISPNPAMGPVTIRITTANRGNGQLRITDAAGKTVYATPIVTTVGSTTLTVGRDVALTNGVYLAQVEVGGHMQTQRFVVQR